MDVWLSDYNDIREPIMRDHNGDGFPLFEQQRDDARAYLNELEVELHGEDVEDEMLSYGNVDIEKEKRDWKYWLKKYESGRWPDFPLATYKDMPKVLGSDAIDISLWNDITVKVREEIARSPKKVSEQATSTQEFSDYIDYMEAIKDHVLETHLNPVIPNGTTAEVNYDTGEEILSRVRRQFFWFITAAVIAISSLIYSASEVDDLAVTANYNQKQTIQNLNSLDHRLAIQEKSIKLLNRSIEILQEEIVDLDKRLTIDEIVFECHISLEVFYGELTRIINGLSALSRNELSVELVNIQGLTRNLIQLRDRMENRGYVLGLEKLEHLFLQPVSYVLYGNGSLYVFSHISCYRKAAVYQLWEYNEIPFLSPTAEGDVAISIRPESNLIGVSEDDARHVLFDYNDIDKCSMVGKMRICDEANVINTKTRESCLSSLLLKDIEKIKNNCRWHSSARREFIQQIGSNEFIGYFVKEESLKIVCTDGKEVAEKRVDVNKAVRIVLQGGCRAYSDHHILEGRLEFSIKTSMYLLNPVNMSALLSTAHFTISPEKWDTWVKIKRDIGNPEGVLFKDVGPMYKQYEENRLWDIGFKSLAGIGIPALLIMGLYFGKDYIFKMCKRSSGEVPNVRYDAGSNLLSIAAQAMTNVGPTRAMPTQTPNMTPRITPRGTPRGTPRASPPRTPPGTSHTYKRYPSGIEETTFMFDPPNQVSINTPKTARKIVNQMDWPEKFKDQIKSSADLIRLAETKTHSVGCKSCGKLMKDCECEKIKLVPEFPTHIGAVPTHVDIDVSAANDEDDDV